MASRSAGSTINTGPMGPVCVLVAVFLLFVSPLMRGGNKQLALIGLEAVGLLFLVCFWIRSVSRGRLSPIAKHEPPARQILLWFLLLSPGWLAIVYLMPVQGSAWEALPSRAIYGQLLAGAGIPLASSMPLSLVPEATKASLLAGIPLVAGFLAGYAARLSQLKVLLGAAAGMAFLEVLLGLLQAAGGSGSTLYFATQFANRPFGTFANSNHYANYIGMALAAYIWLAWTSVFMSGESGYESDGHVGRHRTAFWTAGGLVLVLGILMTLSRGAALSVLPASVLAIGVAYAASGQMRNWRVPVLAALVLVLGAVALVGIGTLLSRYDFGRLATDASFRTLLASSTIAGARELWPWGAGWGTYASAYPRFQPITVDGYAGHAHQDYAQMLFEGGIFAALLAVAFAWLAASRAIHLTRTLVANRMMKPDEFAAAICGVGLLGFLVHSLVEFNMHIPANAILAALLAGVYLRPLPAGDTSNDRPA